MINASPETEAPVKGGLAQASAEPAVAERTPPQALQQRDPIAEQLKKMEEGRGVLNKQIESMRTALDKRTNPEKMPFDPKWLSVTHALSSPTKTGNFIEALGAGAGAMGKAMNEEQANSVAAQQEQLKLAELQQKLNQEDLERQAMLSYQQKRYGTVPSALSGTVSDVSGVQAPLGSSKPIRTAEDVVSSVPPPPQAPTNKARGITMQDIEFYSAIAPTFGAKLKDMAKTEREGLLVTTEGIWNSFTGSWEERFQKPTERTMPVIGKQTLTPDQSKEFDALMAIADKNNLPQSERKRLWEKFYAKHGLGGMGMEDAPAQTSVSSTSSAPSSSAKPTTTQETTASIIGDASGLLGYKPTSGLKTPEQQAFETKQKEAELSLLQKREELKMGSDNDARKKMTEILNTASESAPNLARTSVSLYKLATDPVTKAGFGLLKNGSFQDSLLTAIDKMQVGARPFSVSLDNSVIEAVALSAGKGLKKGVIDGKVVEETAKEFQQRKLQVQNAVGLAARNYAELQLEYARVYLKGEGAVSDNERNIVKALTGTASDRPEMVALKARMIHLRSQFDVKNAEAWSEWSELPANRFKSYNQYKRENPIYKTMVGALDSKMSKIQDEYFPPSGSSGRLESQIR